jgi:1-acyl-sn-glycerol-3-phosphate acyltransferase
MTYRLTRLLALLLWKLFFRIKAYGRDNIPKRGGFILASNHVSYLDPISLSVACPRRISFMAKQELFRNKLFARYLHLLEAFPLKRDCADISALKEAIRRLENGSGLLLFPQGSRGFETDSPEAQPGVGFLASRVNVPIVPAFVKGTDMALPRGAKFIKPRNITVYFGEQISIERRMPYKDIALSIMEEIRRLSCQA